MAKYVRLFLLSLDSTISSSIVFEHSILTSFLTHRTPLFRDIISIIEVINLKHVAACEYFEILKMIKQFFFQNNTC